MNCHLRFSNRELSVGRILRLALPLLSVVATAAPPIHAQEPAQQAPRQQQVPAPSPPTATQAPPLVHLGPLVVLDPAHGGTDTGARGAAGAVEKDVVLMFARAIRAELDRQGFRVVLTRNDDSDPSYDDRAAIANAYGDAVLISLHVSSTGTAATARSYYYRFSNSFAQASNASSTPSGLTPWEEAQRPFADTSHRLADALQLQLAQAFAGSPAVSVSYAVRDLRSVAAPAVAVEVSSVSVSDAAALARMAGPLAAAVARGLAAFRPPAATPAPQGAK